MGTQPAQWSSSELCNAFWHNDPDRPEIRQNQAALGTGQLLTHLAGIYADIVGLKTWLRFRAVEKLLQDDAFDCRWEIRRWAFGSGV